MHSNNRNGSRAAWTRGFVALWAMLAMGLGLMARPAEAAPFAYVVNNGNNTVSVIDTAGNTVVTTIPVGLNPEWLAVTPDGTHVYVTNGSSNDVSVIRTATNTVVKTIPVGSGPDFVAVTPDGTKVYVANSSENSVSVIHRPGNTVVATILVGPGPEGWPLGHDAFNLQPTSVTVSTFRAALALSRPAEIAATTAFQQPHVARLFADDARRKLGAHWDHETLPPLGDGMAHLVQRNTQGTHPVDAQGVAVRSRRALLV
ncbi:MAG: beta-propeller fold lactonase family protein [Methylocella sp.]